MLRRFLTMATKSVLSATNTMPSRSPGPIASAGCLIIGDEVLNGKILDTNSHFFARHCFNELCIPVKKTIVCGDDKDDIKGSLQTLMRDGCDFIVTSGGIGPTHDDITYEAIAEAFGIDCVLDNETVQKMQALRAEYLDSLSERRRNAFYRMATFPCDASGSVKVDRIFTEDSLWVPVVAVQSQIYILPGVPQLFQKLLLNLTPSIKPRIDAALLLKRFFVKTNVKESELAPFLSDLQDECNAKYGAGNVKLGSYPHFSWKLNTVSAIGNEKVSKEELQKIVDRIATEVGGDVITAEEEELMTTTSPASTP